MAFLDRVKVDTEELLHTNADPMTFYTQFVKNWKEVEFPIPGQDEISVQDGVIRVIGEGRDTGHRIEVLLDVEPVESGLRVWSRIEYPSSKFWWALGLIGIPFGYGLPLLGILFVLDLMGSKPEGAKAQFEKVVNFTAASLEKASPV